MSNELIIGMHSAIACLEHEPEQVLELFVLKTKQDSLPPILQELIIDLQLQPQWVNKSFFAQFSTATHQGIALRLKTKVALNEFDLEEFVKKLAHPALILVLDGVQDPHNLGACLRSADAAGADCVVIPKNKAVGLNASVRKSASGAAETMPLFYVTNLVRSLKALQALGVWCTGLDLATSSSFFQLDFKGSCAIVLGSEGQGLRPSTKASCDYLAKMPMQGHVQSLNVSVAAGIAMFEVGRQRTSK